MDQNNLFDRLSAIDVALNGFFSFQAGVFMQALPPSPDLNKAVLISCLGVPTFTLVYRGLTFPLRKGVEYKRIEKERAKTLEKALSEKFTPSMQAAYLQNLNIRQSYLDNTTKISSLEQELHLIGRTVVTSLAAGYLVSSLLG